jgi:hypothetical protein
MKIHPALRSAAGALCASAVLAACSSAPEVSNVPSLAPSSSVAQANQRLAAVARERAAIEARFAERERVCYDKFFVNHCLDEAKERRRSALAAQRAIEIEASHYLREEKVEERERAMAEAEARYKAEEEALANQPAPAKEPRGVTEAPPPRPSQAAGRIARHNAKVQEAAAREQADAAKRAANVEAYNKRKAESEERQRIVAKRKAEKAEKDAKKQGVQNQQPAPAATPTPTPVPPAQ